MINNHVSVGTYSVMAVHPVAFSDRSLQLQEKQKILGACYYVLVTSLQARLSRLWQVKNTRNRRLSSIKVVAVGNERWPLARVFKYIDLTWKLLILWKTGRWEFVSYPLKFNLLVHSGWWKQTSYHSHLPHTKASGWYLWSRCGLLWHTLRSARVL